MLLAVRRFISYNIKLLKATVVSPHKEESLLYVCSVYKQWRRYSIPLFKNHGSLIGKAHT